MSSPSFCAVSNAGTRVLLVDDEPMMLEVLDALLSLIGCEVVGTAVNGQEAVSRRRELEPDLVVMDVGMPVMDGIAATRQIRMECETPVIICSGMADQDTKARCSQAGAGAFIPKPVAFDLLEKTVQGAVRGAAAAM